VEQDAYKQNRKKRLTIPKAIQIEIENTYDHIHEYQKDESFSLSREDIYCIATALEMNILLVTDDQAMITTCKEFDIKVCSTLELMRLMFDNNHIDLEKVIEITEYWKYEKDEPTNFKKELKKYFNELVKK